MPNRSTQSDEHCSGTADVSAVPGSGQVSEAGRRTREGFTLGRLAFEKISAVEGIRLTATMKRDLRRSAEETTTPDAARQRLAAKYGKPSA